MKFNNTKFESDLTLKLSKEGKNLRKLSEELNISEGDILNMCRSDELPNKTYLIRLCDSIGKGVKEYLN